MEERTDSYLVETAKATLDRAVFNELFSRHHNRLRAFMAKRANESVVDDVLQETYIKAFINIRKFTGNSAFSTWLFSISINEYRAMLRRRTAYEKLINFLTLQSYNKTYTKHNDVLIDFTRRAELLPPLQYDILVLSLVYGYSHGEIAKNCDLPLGSVKTYLAQAMKKVKVNDDN